MCRRLQGTATKILELASDKTDFLSAAVALAVPLPRVRRAAIHIKAMGLWRPSLDTVGCP